MNKSVNDLLLGINLIYKSKTVKAYFAFITCMVLISEDDVTETAQDLQAVPDPGYHHEVNNIIVFLEHCMSFW